MLETSLFFLMSYSCYLASEAAGITGTLEPSWYAVLIYCGRYQAPQKDIICKN